MFEFRMTILLYFIENWHYGPEIGNTNTSHYQTAMCPQQGGEFTNMHRTQLPPVYGKKKWTDCANHCKNLPDCNYWQWKENEMKCITVTSFDGFKRNDNVFSGHKNCPLDRNALFSLCPTKGDNSQMWRETTAAFYSPSIAIGIV